MMKRGAKEEKGEMMKYKKGGMVKKGK